MKFTNEQMKKARMAKSPEELMSLAKLNGIDLSTDEAKKHYDSLHYTGAISDDELANVSGGGCGIPNPKANIGQRVQWAYPTCYIVYSGTIVSYKWDEYKGMYEYKIRRDKDQYVIGVDEDLILECRWCR